MEYGTTIYPTLWQKAQESFLIPLFSYVPMSSPSTIPSDPTLGTYPESDRFSSPPWLPPWSKPTSSHTWTTATFLTGLSNIATRVCFLNYNSYPFTELKSHQGLPIALRITVKLIAWPPGLCDLVHISLPIPTTLTLTIHLGRLPLTSLCPTTSAFLLAVLDKPALSLLFHRLKMFFPHVVTWHTSHHSNVTCLNTLSKITSYTQLNPTDI